MFAVFNTVYFDGLLHEILRPGVLWFLRNPHNPQQDIFRELVLHPMTDILRQLVLSVAGFTFLIGLALALPIRVVSILFPRTLPFVWIPSPTFDIPVDILFYNVGLPTLVWGLARAHVIDRAVRAVLQRLARIFSLSSYMLNVRYDDEVAIPGTEVRTVRSAAHTFEVAFPPSFRLRVTGFVLAATLIAISVTSSLLFGPLVVGRAAFRLLSLARADGKVHDGYSIFAGVIILAILAYVANEIRRKIARVDRQEQQGLSIPVRRAFGMVVWLLFSVGFLIGFCSDCLFVCRPRCRHAARIRLHCIGHYLERTRS